MWNTLLKPLLPYFAAIGIFAVVSIAYFIPEVFQNKTMITVDGTGGMGAGKEISDYQKQTGKKTLWTNALFGGMPTYQISPDYPSTRLISYVQYISGLFLPYPANLVFMLLFGAFLLFLALGANPRIAIIGAIAYAFSSYFFILIHTGHIWKLLVLASIPPTFAGIIWAYRGKYLLGGAVTAIYASLQLVSNHPQMTYYFGILVLLFVISELVICIKNKTLIRFITASGVLLFAGLIAFAINSTNIYHSWQYSKYTMRGPSELKTNSTNQTSGIDRDYATNWSYGIEETFTLMIPDFKGGATGAIGNDEKPLQNVLPQFRQDIAKTNRYWGNQPFTEGPVYVGAFIMFLFVYGLFIIKGRWKWVLLAGTGLSILLYFFVYSFANSFHKNGDFSHGIMLNHCALVKRYSCMRNGTAPHPPRRRGCQGKFPYQSYPLPLPSPPAVEPNPSYILRRCARRNFWPGHTWPVGANGRKLP